VVHGGFFKGGDFACGGFDGGEVRIFGASKDVVEFELAEKEWGAYLD
jgi:hypothetical protein